MAVSSASPPIDQRRDTERLEALEQKLDRMAEQMDLLYQRAQAMESLREELSGVGREVVAAASLELAEIQDDIDLDTLRHLLIGLLRATPRLQRFLERLEAIDQLASELEPLGRDVFVELSHQLQIAEERGYFRLMRGGMRLFDRISTHTTDEDIERLADNIVLIVETIKRMTQPQLLSALNRIAEVLDNPKEHAPAIGLLGLLRAMRDPEIQQGLGVAIELLRQVSSPPETTPSSSNP